MVVSFTTAFNVAHTLAILGVFSGFKYPQNEFIPIIKA